MKPKDNGKTYEQLCKSISERQLAEWDMAFYSKYPEVARRERKRLGIELADIGYKDYPLPRNDPS